MSERELIRQRYTTFGWWVVRQSGFVRGLIHGFMFPVYILTHVALSVPESWRAWRHDWWNTKRDADRLENAEEPTP